MVYGLSGNYNALNGLNSSSLGLITGSTNNLGCTTPIFGGYGINSDAAVSQTKKQIQNGYDVNTYSQAYSNKQSIESMDLTRQGQNIQYLLKQGRSDDAMKEYREMVRGIASLNQYSDYTTSQIKTLAQTEYQNATGSTIIKDISNNTDGSFMTGLQNGTVVGSLFSNSDNSRNDLLGMVTGTPASTSSALAECLGTALSGAGTVAAGFGAYSVGKTMLSKNAGTIGEKAGNIFKNLSESFKGSNGKTVAIAAAGAAAILGIGSLVKSAFNSHKADNI